MTKSFVARIPVVFVIDNMRIGGTELNAVRTAELLDRDRFDLRVVCLSGDGPITARYGAIEVPIETFPLKSFYGPSMVASGSRFVRYLRANNVQIVHAHDMYSNVFVTPWTRLARTPVVITSRRWWHSLPSAKLQSANRVAFHLADAVLANSPQVARSVEEQEGVRHDRVWTISNFVDESAFEPLSDSERAQVRRDWNIPADTVAVGCVARLLPVKDHDTLLRAFALLRATRPNAHLVLVGDGQSRAALETLSMTLGIADATTFVGEISNGTNHHRIFDVSVLCSLSEGFPNTLVEAMAAGVPIVATAVGGNIDAVTDGENGLLVPASSPAEVASALDALVGDAALRARMGSAGRARAAAKYRARDAVGSLEGMYDSLLGRG